MKEVRAILRLVRAQLGKKFYQQENSFFRDMAKKMSDLRDHEVFIDTLEELKTYTSEVKIHAALDKIIQQANTHYDEEKERLLNQENMLETVSQKLSDAQKHIDSWPIEGNKFKLIADGIYRVYDRGQKAFHKAYENPDIENFHEFRKRVKYLSYQVEFLENAWKKVLKSYRKEISKLSDFLGKEHDFGMLIQKIHAIDYGISKEETATITGIAQDKRNILQNQALPLAKCIYSDTPDEFVGRLQNYWKAWKLEIE
jgi:CHAD domain-containing protein